MSKLDNILLYPKTVWYFFKPHKIKSCLLIMLAFLAGGLETMSLAALYPVINYGLDVQAQGTMVGFFEGLLASFSVEGSLRSACILLLVVAFFAVTARFMYHYFGYSFMMQISREAQKKAFQQFVQADIDFYHTHQQGKLIYNGATAPRYASGLVLATIRLFYDAVNALFLLSLLLLLSLEAALVLFVVGFCYAFFTKKIIQKITLRCSILSMEGEKEKNVVLNELITGIKSIKVYQSIQTWRDKFYKAMDQHLNNQLKMLMGRALPESFIKLAFFGLLGGVGIYLSYQPEVMMKELLPVFGTFVVVTNRLLPSVQIIGTSFLSICECLPHAQVVRELSLQEVSTLTYGDIALENPKDKITFKDVWFRYTDDTKDVVKGISFDIHMGDFTALVGVSGAGKTTIINLLLRLYKPNRGTIFIDGEDIFSFTNRSYLDHIAYVSQTSFIYNSTIRENICFGREDYSEQEIVAAAKLANAHDFINETPNGYDTLVGDSGIKLSGGQKQRIAIARAMLRKPTILIMDEATSSLDNISEKKIQDAIEDIAKFTTVIVIAHRLSTIKRADKIVILDDGVVKDQGTHDALMKNRGLYTYLNEVQDAGQQKNKDTVNL